MASGLPSSEDADHAVDLETLKAIPLSPKQQLDLFIGIFSTANNFKRRMAVRRTWMQYDSVRKGKVAVRFFVGLVLSLSLVLQLISSLLSLFCTLYPVLFYFPYFPICFTLFASRLLPLRGDFLSPNLYDSILSALSPSLSILSLSHVETISAAAQEPDGQ